MISRLGVGSWPDKQMEVGTLVGSSVGWGSGHPLNGIPRNEYDDSLSPPINQIDIAHSAGISAGAGWKVDH